MAIPNSVTLCPSFLKHVRVLNRLDECKQAARAASLKSKRKPMLQGVFVDRPREKTKLRRKPVGCQVVEEGNTEQLKRFVALVAAHGEMQ